MRESNASLWVIQNLQSSMYFHLKFYTITRPLISLIRKDISFKWGNAQQDTITCLTDKIIKSLALHHLDYKSSWGVVFAVNTFVIAISFILSQEGENGKHYLNCFCSISLMSIESQCSQAKLKLYDLFWALRAVCIFIFGVTNLVIEMDVKYVKDIINNLDLQPNIFIN